MSNAVKAIETLRAIKSIKDIDIVWDEEDMYSEDENNWYPFTLNGLPANDLGIGHDVTGCDINAVFALETKEDLEWILGEVSDWYLWNGDFEYDKNEMTIEVERIIGLFVENQIVVLKNQIVEAMREGEAIDTDVVAKYNELIGK